MGSVVDVLLQRKYILMFESIYCLGLKIRLIFWAMICKVKFLVVVVVVIVGGGGVGEVGLGVKLGGGGGIKILF